MSSKVVYEARGSAFEKRISTSAVINRDHSDIREFFDDAYTHFEKCLREVLATFPCVKVNTIFSATFEKPHKPTTEEQQQPPTNSTTIGDGFDSEPGDKQMRELDSWLDAVFEREFGSGLVPAPEPLAQAVASAHTERETKYYNTKNTKIDQFTDLRNFFDTTIRAYVLGRIDDAVLKGSGLSLLSINELVIQVNKYNPLRGSSYIQTPKWISDKQAIVNVQNIDDDECFKWAILSTICKVKRNAFRTSVYPTNHPDVDFSNLKFPLPVDQIYKFENKNPGFSVNVYAIAPNEKKIYPLRLAKEVKDKHIHLLYLQKTMLKCAIIHISRANIVEVLITNATCCTQKVVQFRSSSTTYHIMIRISFWRRWPGMTLLKAG